MRSRKQSRRANGEGSIFWSDSYGRYVGMATLPRTSDGKLRRKKVFGKRGDRSSAARLGVKERIDKYFGRRGTRDGAAQLKAFADKWIENAPIRTNTRVMYESIIKNHLGALGSKNLIDVEPYDIRQHLDGLETGAAMKQKIRTFLHRIFREAVDLDMIASNPVARVRAPKVEHRERPALTPQEVYYLLKAVEGDRLEALVVLALASGMGPAELLGLRRRDVFLTEGFVQVTGDLVQVPGGSPTIEATKTKHRRRRIDLPSFATDALRERLKLCFAERSGELVFTTVSGKPIHDDNLRHRWWKPLIEKAAALAEKDARAAGDSSYRFPANFRMYDMRHTANALAALAGVAIEVEQKRMGHSSIRTTNDKYGHVFRSMQRGAAGLLETLFTAIRTGTAEPDEVALLHPLLHGDNDKTQKAI